MAISRWDPFRDLMDIQNELNRLFTRTYGSDAPEGVRGAGWSPPMDVYETPEAFVILMELPGVSPEEVDISVEDATLTIAGERRFYVDPGEESFLRIERRFGQFSRQVSLPTTADVGGISASFDAGVLTIQVRKKEEAKPRKITIKASA